MLRLENISVFVEKKPIINQLNFSFEKNKIYAVMGPNGSGKSTLALAIIGHPAYQIEGKIFFGKKLINDLTPDKRAKLGIFSSFQSPLSLQGVNVFQLLKESLGSSVEPVKLKKKIISLAKSLHLKEELLFRSLNDNASGGERKRMEIVQMAILKPKFIILDEIDTGLDIDGLKVIANFLNDFFKGRTIVMITHYNRILKYLRPDKVLVMMNGRVVLTGDRSLVDQVEEFGYQKLLKTYGQPSI